MKETFELFFISSGKLFSLFVDMQTSAVTALASSYSGIGDEEVTKPTIASLGSERGCLHWIIIGNLRPHESETTTEQIAGSAMLSMH